VHLHIAQCMSLAVKVTPSGLSWHQPHINRRAQYVFRSSRSSIFMVNTRQCRLQCTAPMPCAAVQHADDQPAQQPFWQMPDDVCVQLIDTASSLAAVQQDLLPGGRLADTDAVGIDAEWAPGAATPAAALLQLALRSLQTGACTALVLVSCCSSAMTSTLQCFHHQLMLMHSFDGMQTHIYLSFCRTLSCCHAMRQRSCFSGCLRMLRC
jgi:hypothetical protein